MHDIRLHDKVFTPFLSKDTIDKAVRQVAAEIYKDLKGEVPLFLGVLNGSFMFVADLVRAYPEHSEISFIKLASYTGDSSLGSVKTLLGINEDLKGRTVVLLEDIVDTGNTLEEIYTIFKCKNVKALKIATLFYKPDVFNKNLTIDYIGLEIPDKFIVGYGLDYNGLGRNLSSIYQLK